MAKLVWDQTAEHLYETGDDHAVVYPYNAQSKAYDTGVAWNGITGITESPSGADETALYADNIKYLSLRAAEEFGMTVTAYTYPDEFAVLDGSAFAEDLPGVRIYQQARKTFGMSYRTIIGNDTEANDYGYKLHLVYGLTASPSERGYGTVNDSPEANEFSWEMTGVPVAITGYKNSCLITIDSTAFNTEDKKAKLKALEDVLYGTDDTYTEFSGSTFETGVDYYEKVGATYVKTTDETPQSGKTYYTVSAAGTAARLPLPDEVFSILKGIGG